MTCQHPILSLPIFGPFKVNQKWQFWGFVKFQVCLKELNISFEPEFGNPSFETLEKPNVFNYQLTCFSVHICWFYSLALYSTSLRRETWSFKLVFQFFLCSAAEEGYQTQLFKTRVLTQPDLQKSTKSISNLKKATCVYFKRSIFFPLFSKGLQNWCFLMESTLTFLCLS